MTKGEGCAREGNLKGKDCWEENERKGDNFFLFLFLFFSLYASGGSKEQGEGPAGMCEGPVKGETC